MRFLPGLSHAPPWSGFPHLNPDLERNLHVQTRIKSMQTRTKISVGERHDSPPAIMVVFGMGLGMTNPGVYALQCAFQTEKQVFFLVFVFPPVFGIFFPGKACFSLYSVWIWWFLNYLVPCMVYVA